MYKNFNNMSSFDIAWEEFPTASTTLVFPIQKAEFPTVGRSIARATITYSSAKSEPKVGTARRSEAELFKPPYSSTTFFV